MWEAEGGEMVLKRTLNPTSDDSIAIVYVRTAVDSRHHLSTHLEYPVMKFKVAGKNLRV
jgi:hypothetical protein